MAEGKGKIKLTIFISLFVLFYVTAHLLVFFAWAKLYDIENSPLLQIITVLLAFFFPLAILLENHFDNKLSRLFYLFASFWFGTQFIALCVTMFFAILDIVFGMPILWSRVLIPVTLVVLVIAATVNGNVLYIRKRTIPLKKLKKPLRIVHLSDIHVGTIHNSAFLKRVVRETNKLHPDMILITGDLFDGSGKVRWENITPLTGFKAPTFFCTGNHEEYEGIDRVTNLLGKTKITVLRNASCDCLGVQIIGLDNPADPLTRTSDILPKIPISKNKPVILLFHMPSGVEEAHECGVDLQLSGHTHNGQLFPFGLLVKCFFPYVKGLYNYKGMYVHVSPGTGTWGPPMRLGSRCEIAVLDLVRK